MWWVSCYVWGTLLWLEVLYQKNTFWGHICDLNTLYTRFKVNFFNTFSPIFLLRFHFFAIDFRVFLGFRGVWGGWYLTMIPAVPFWTSQNKARGTLLWYLLYLDYYFFLIGFCLCFVEILRSIYSFTASIFSVGAGIFVFGEWKDTDFLQKLVIFSFLCSFFIGAYLLSKVIQVTGDIIVSSVLHPHSQMREVEIFEVGWRFSFECG